MNNQEVERQLSHIDMKQERALLNRQSRLEERLKTLKSRPELENLLQTKMEREEKYLEEIFKKVTLKRKKDDDKQKKLLQINTLRKE